MAGMGDKDTAESSQPRLHMRSNTHRGSSSAKLFSCFLILAQVLPAGTPLMVIEP